MEGPTVSNATAGSRVGSQFGHYLLKRLLGSGGFGEVYEAQDTEMDRVVAIKLLSAHYSQNAGFRQRLYREARTAGQLYEPHVVPIHRCGEINGQLYIDMRYIEGADLHAILAQCGQLEPARAVAIVRQIGSALDAAHAKHMVHRDIKPANILLTGDDFAYLVDFGLANAATDAVLTSTNTTIGTFAYMAPERLGNAEVSHHTDTYALACVLYECLTGSPPYPAHDLPALITAHLNAPIPRPSQHGSQIPAGFDSVIARGMAKNPRDRYASAGDLATAAYCALTTPYQQDADTILAYTQAAFLPVDDLAATRAAATPPRAVYSAIPARTPPKPVAAPSYARAATAIAVLAVAVVLIGLAGLAVKHQWRNATSGAPSTSVPSSTPTRQYGKQVTVPITGLDHPEGIAVDAAGNVYVADMELKRVVKLLAGSQSWVDLPFTGLRLPREVAVDTVGNVYVTDIITDEERGHGLERVLKLPAGSATQVELPFTGLMNLEGVGVDASGNVYVGDFTSPPGRGDQQGRVLKMPAGSTTQVELPFTGIEYLAGMAVDADGNVYVTDENGVNHGQGVLKLPAGSKSQVELPFTGLPDHPKVAVDTAGNVYITGYDYNAARVLKLPLGSNIQVDLPLTGVREPGGIAADTSGNIYVTDRGHNLVLKLPAN